MSLPNTHYGAKMIGNILSGKKTLFFDGIGGVSMCSLAKIAALRGYKVSGYDRTETDVTRALSADGITVYYNEDAAHIDGADALIYTVAIPETNPEYSTAVARGIPCISRADFLGYIMSGYEERIGISGMHGKSTTTAMIEAIFHYAKKDPTVSCGAYMNGPKSTFRIGSHDFFIFEACEYMDSFLDFYPTTAVILNIEMDHVDYFKSIEQIETSFAGFIAKTESAGHPRVVVNMSNESAMRVVSGYHGETVTFSKDLPDADYTASNIELHCGCASFDLICRGKNLTRVSLQVPGEHMITDALAAAATAHVHGIPAEDIASALAEYSGIERRMEKCGKAKTGAVVYSDYAHHPTEIASSLKTAAEMGFDRVVCAFQSHTFSRTFKLFDGFAEALANNNVDEVIIADIYPARETNTFGVSAEALAEKIASFGKKCRFIDSFDKIENYMLSSTKDGEMILIIGAGDIDKVARDLVK